LIIFFGQKNEPFIGLIRNNNNSSSWLKNEQKKSCPTTSTASCNIKSCNKEDANPVDNSQNTLGGHTDGISDKEEALGNFLFLDNLWAKDGIPCLEAVLIGDAGSWATGKSDDVIRDAVLKFMEDAMGSSVDWSSPSSSASLSLSECCVDCHVTRWEEDPFSKGAYSGFQLGTMDWHCAELSRSEWDGHLIFAGEATHQEYEGSVHAALLSGVEAAKKIVSVAFPS